MELAHPDLFPHEIGGHVIPFLQACDGRQAGGDGHAQAGIGPVRQAFHQHTVDDIAAADDARPDGDRTDGLHAGETQDRLFRREMDREGRLLGRDCGGTGDAHIPGQGGDAVPHGMTESGRDGDGHDDDEETHGDGHRRESPLEFEFAGYETVRGHATRCGRAPPRDGTSGRLRGCRRRRRRSGSS